MIPLNPLRGLELQPLVAATPDLLVDALDVSSYETVLIYWTSYGADPTATQILSLEWRYGDTVPIEFDAPGRPSLVEDDYTMFVGKTLRHAARVKMPRLSIVALASGAGQQISLAIFASSEVVRSAELNENYQFSDHSVNVAANGTVTVPIDPYIGPALFFCTSDGGSASCYGSIVNLDQGGSDMAIAGAVALPPQVPVNLMPGRNRIVLHNNLAAPHSYGYAITPGP